MTYITKCETCGLSLDDDSFWDIHQTMQYGNIWCTKKGKK